MGFRGGGVVIDNETIKKNISGQIYVPIDDDTLKYNSVSEEVEVNIDDDTIKKNELGKIYVNKVNSDASPQFWKKIYSYTLPATLSGASSYSISSIPARPTLNTSKMYLIDLKKITTSQNISLFNIFGNSTTNGYIYYFTSTSTQTMPSAKITESKINLLKGIDYLFDAFFGFLYRISGIVQNDANKINIVLNTTGTITELDFDIYECDVV